MDKFGIFDLLNALTGQKSSENNPPAKVSEEKDKKTIYRNAYGNKNPDGTKKYASDELMRILIRHDKISKQIDEDNKNS